MEKSKNVADVHHLRLMSLLQELVRDQGGMKGAARTLGIDHRTVAGSMAEGELTRRRAMPWSTCCWREGARLRRDSGRR